MKPAELERWSVLRAKGKLRYVLLHGLLAYGLPMFLVMTFFVRPEPRTPVLIAISAALWAAGGLVFGLIMWHINERRYRKASTPHS